MRAKIEPGYERQRKRLADVVPLEAPFTLFLCPTHKCNFQCFYCTHSCNQLEKKKMGIDYSEMKKEIFFKIVSQIKQFPVRLKRILINGLGEPLMNSYTPDMIRILAEADVAEKYEMFTNAYLLTPEVTDRLVDSGLTFLRISLQGLSAEKYQEVAGVKIDFDRLVDNIKYFYHKKGNCKLYIKIMDACLDSKEDEERFYNIFGDICDQIYIEHILRAQYSMMDNYGDNINSEFSFYGEKSEVRDVCHLLFYILQINANGEVFPCSTFGLPKEFSLGNVNDKTLYEMWNGKERYNLLMSHLKGKRYGICKDCENYLCNTPQQDNLDYAKDEIVKHLEEYGYV